MAEVFVGLGSNVEPERHLRTAVARLRARFGAVRLSPVYRNPAVGFAGGDFLNLVAAFDSEEDPLTVRAALETIESVCGRVRGGPRFVPRTLDIDLLLYGELVSESPLKLPRQEILKYAFVLKPLADLAGERRHPLTGRRFLEHWADFRGLGGALVPVQVEGL